jgi:hypothetical protein
MKPLNYWLSQIVGNAPIDDLWRSRIEELWESGALEFRKIPTEKSDHDIRCCLPGKLMGKSRPIFCPEAPPVGTQFELWFHDGVEWKSGEVTPLSDPERKVESVRRRELLETAMKKELGVEEMISGMELRILENHGYRPKETLPFWYSIEKSLKDPIDMDDLAAVFAAGVLYGRAQARSYIKDTSEEGFADEIMRDVVKFALSRHGDLGTKDLLEKMGGTRDQITNNWFFGSRVIDHDEFHKAVKAEKASISRRSSQLVKKS